EIRVSSILRMWGRADALLGRLRECTSLAAAETNAVRAQHLFMRRYLATELADDHGMAGWFWSARPLNKLPQLASRVWATAAPQQLWLTAPTDAPPPEAVYDAVAEASWPAPSWLKPLLLGRVESELELRPEAITNFEVVLADSEYPAALRESIYEA